MNGKSTPGIPEDRVDLTKLLESLWRGKWTIAVSTLAFGLISAGYALLATEWYRAEVTLMPSKDNGAPTLVGQLGGLASLAGVNVGTGDTVEAVATLRSRDLSRDFLSQDRRAQILLSEESGNYLALENGESIEKLDIRDAVDYFQENILTVNENRQTGLVTIAIQWTDPVLAAEWANALASLLNERLRGRALRDAEANIGYLEEQLAKTSVVTLQQAIGRLLEAELQKFMLASGNDEFAFRVVDPAVVPNKIYRPKKIIAIGFGFFLGFGLGVFGVLSSQREHGSSKVA